MKKKVAMLALAACAAAFAGLTVSAAEQNSLFAQMKQANSLDALQEKYAMSWMDSERYFADGTVEKTHVYLDSERYMRDSDGDVAVDTDGDVYGYNLEAGTAYRYLFVDGAYEDFRDRESLVPWGNYEDEDIYTGAVESVDDTHSKATVEVNLVPYTALFAHYGYTVEEGDVVRYEFTADQTSGEITDTQAYFVKADGTQTLFEKGTTVLGGSKDPEEPDAGMRDWIFSDDSRTLTVIADAGTADEKTYTQTAGKGCWIVIAYADDYAADGNSYDDPAYTQIHQYNANETQEDVTLYIRKAGSAAGQQSTTGTNTQQTESTGTADEYAGMAKCPFCGLWFSTLEKADGSLSDFRFHTQLEMEYGVSMAQCPICGQWFSTYASEGLSDYQAHSIWEQEREAAAEQNAEAMAQCPICGQWFSTYASEGLSDYQAHAVWEQEQEAAAQNPENLAQCPICGQWFSTYANEGLSDYQAHAIWEQEQEAAAEQEAEDMAQCPICGQWFSTYASEGLSDYQAHAIWEQEQEAAAQNPENLAQCPICGQWFSTYASEGLSDYQAHSIWEQEQEAAAEQSAEDTEMVQCPYCGDWFEAGNVFRNHVCPARDAAYAQE